LPIIHITIVILIANYILSSYHAVANTLSLLQKV
jgi:hypothetical protein